MVRPYNITLHTQHLKAILGYVLCKAGFYVGSCNNKAYCIMFMASSSNEYTPRLKLNYYCVDRGNFILLLYSTHIATYSASYWPQCLTHACLAGSWNLRDS